MRQSFVQLLGQGAGQARENLSLNPTGQIWARPSRCEEKLWQPGGALVCHSGEASEKTPVIMPAKPAFAPEGLFSLQSAPERPPFAARIASVMKPSMNCHTAFALGWNAWPRRGPLSPRAYQLATPTPCLPMETNNAGEAYMARRGCRRSLACVWCRSANRDEHDGHQAQAPSSSACGGEDSNKDNR